MTGRRLIFNDGTTIENGEAGNAGDTIGLYFYGFTMAEAAALTLDSGKTERIVFQYGDMQDEYEGYTDCRSISINNGGQISVYLREVVA